MMEISFEQLTLTKLMPLGISRGVSTGSINLYVRVRQGEHEGIGECAPGTGFTETLAAQAQSELASLVGSITEGMSIHEVWQLGMSRGLDSGAVAALDTALWDLKAKQAGMPLIDLLGLPWPTVPTSVTIGINPPEVVREKVPWLLSHTGGKFLKVKLGSPEGIEADQAMYEACVEVARPFGVGLRVDANGGWSLADAQKMIPWLAARGCDYVEQPLVAGGEEGLPVLFEGRALPIFIDESCRVAADVVKYAHCVDGVNLKLMKCGGITEGLRLIATARACGLQTMIGCMSDSSVAIAAGAVLTGLLDHVDLDSHLNQNPDPASGLGFVDGIVMPRQVPGHGAFLE